MRSNGCRSEIGDEFLCHQQSGETGMVDGQRHRRHPTSTTAVAGTFPTHSAPRLPGFSPRGNARRAVPRALRCSSRPACSSRAYNVRKNRRRSLANRRCGRVRLNAFAVARAGCAVLFGQQPGARAEFHMVDDGSRERVPYNTGSAFAYNSGNAACPAAGYLPRQARAGSPATRRSSPRTPPRVSGKKAHCHPVPALARRCHCHSGMPSGFWKR